MAGAARRLQPLEVAAVGERAAARRARPVCRRRAGGRPRARRRRARRNAASRPHHSGTGKGPFARALLVTFVESVSLSSTSSRRCSVGTSYDLVGGASSYSRSGLSAIAMLPPDVRRGIRDFADSAARQEARTRRCRPLAAGSGGEQLITSAAAVIVIPAATRSQRR